MKNPRLSGALLVALGLQLAAPGPAAACTTDGPRIGLSLRGPRPPSLPVGGVLPVGGAVLGADVAAALARVTEFRVTRGHADVPGALTVVTVASGTSPEGLALHDVILVWRPEAPPVLGDELVVHYRYDDVIEETWSVTVRDDPTAVALPEVGVLARTVEVAEPERICCELLADSCDRTSLCLPTRARQIAAIALQDARLAGAWPQGYLWVARQGDDGEPGPPLLRPPDPYIVNDDERPAWAAWSADVPFPAPADSAPYCVFVGVTSLVDGARVVSDPLCVTAGQVGELGVVELAPDLPAHALAQHRECASDPVYEADGAPYPRPQAEGCRVAPRPTAPLLLLLPLALLRRRREA